MSYPAWAWFPRQNSAPDWVRHFIACIEEARPRIDSTNHKGMTSDGVVRELREDLERLGWEIESGKTKAGKIHRPVLFGDNGRIRVHQEIDGWQPDLRILLEIESGRAWMGNAVYRDLIRASLVADADFLVVGVRQYYEYGKNPVSRNDFESTRDLMDSIYASQRLQLPFQGVLIFGW